MSILKIKFFLLILGFSCLIVQGQVVTSDPLFPTAADSVRIIFNANEGSRGLADFAGPIWAHTGLITDQSTSPTDWRYVIAAWSQNLDKAKLTSLGNNLWELKIGPSIRSYYNVSASVKVLKLAFVFRNQDGSKEGKATGGGDILLDIYQPGLNLSILQPQTNFLVLDPQQELSVHAATTGSDSILLIHDGNQLTKTVSPDLNFSFVVENEGLHQVKVVAWLGTQSVRDSFQYYIKGPDFYQELPPGVIDGINYIDSQSVVLVLFAPEKDHVFVLGDFNGWQIDPRFLLHKTPDLNRYWIKIENLTPQKEYIFQYLVDGTIRIADPYSTKVSDPWNDQYIGSRVYPGLIPYPAGKTTQIASVLQTDKVPYDWKNPAFQAPDASKLVIYELLTRDFTSCHTFGCMMDTLNYLEKLGVTAIELMPVNEFEGNDSWGYNPSFYFAPDKYYGPSDNLKAFIDACHERGMAVIVDMVLNHSYGQSPLVRLYWDDQNNRPAANNPWYNVQSPNSTYSWGYDFNHESLYTQQFVDSVNSYWLREFHVDGFRFDFTKGFTNTPGDGGAYDASRIRLLERMYTRIREVSPSAYVILEHFADNREEKELSSYGMMIWGNCNYNYRKASSSYFLEAKSDFSWISWQKRGWTVPNLVGYMESHDEERLMYECYYWGNVTNPSYRIKDTTIALQRMELDANFFIPVPGPKMIWMFGELGYDYSINLNGRVGAKPIRWDYLQDYRRKRVLQTYAALNHLKQAYPVFSTTDFFLDFADTVKRINLSDDSMNVTILGNFGTRPSAGDPGFQHGGWWYEYWSGDSLEVFNVHSKIDLTPGEYRLYTDVRLAKPDVVSSIRDIDNHWYSVMNLSVYPNPATGKLFVDAHGQVNGEVRLSVIDLQGREALSTSILNVSSAGVFSLDIGSLDPGVYFVELQSDRGRAVARWIKN